MTYSKIQKVKNKFEIHSRQEELDLIKKAQSGCDHSWNELITNNIKLVINIANKFGKSKEDLEDLVGEGVLGLAEAIKKFDLSKANKFTTYGTYWVYNKISKHVKSNTKSAYFPSYLINAAVSVGKYQNQYFEKYGEDPSVQEICKEFGYKTSTVNKILSFFETEHSLNEDRGEDEDYSLLNVIDSNKYHTDAKDNLAKKILDDNISEEAKELLELNYGLTDKKRVSYKDLGLRYGKPTREIRKIIQDSKNKLAVALNNKKFYYNYE